MSLLDEILSVQEDRSGCKVKRLLDSMTPDDRSDLETALANPNIPATHIARVLHNRGLEVNYKTLANHRRQDCACHG